MISREERQHIVKLKQWSEKTRSAMQSLLSGPFGKLYNSLNPGIKPDLIFDNVDWLIALIERESHTASVKRLLESVEAHKKEKR